MYPSVYSEQAREAITIGQRHHCTFRVVGMGTIEKAYYSNQMVYEPADINFTTIPDEARRRVEILKRAGIPIKDYILRHDAPLILNEPPKPPKPPFKLPEIKTDKLVSVGKVIVAATTIAAMGLLQLLGLVMAVAVDPGLIVVLDDEYETQVEVMTWLA